MTDPQTRLQSENTRMRAALQHIADRKWAATTLDPGRWVSEFCVVASEALEGRDLTTDTDQTLQPQATEKRA